MSVWRHSRDCLTCKVSYPNILSAPNTYLSNGRVVQGEQYPQSQVDITSTSCLSGKADSEVPTAEVNARAEYVPRQFCQDLRGNESGPAVHFAWSLPDFVDIAHVDERNLKLLGKGNANNQGNETCLGVSLYQNDKLHRMAMVILTKSLFCVPWRESLLLKYVKPTRRPATTLSATFAMMNVGFRQWAASRISHRCTFGISEDVPRRSR